MEQRRAERYPLQLNAMVMPSPLSAEGVTDDHAFIRDISSSGAAFSSGESWEKGQEVALLIRFDKSIVKPFSYNLRVKGRIVRQEINKASGDAYFAVEFGKKWKFLNWEESGTA
jgi:hypothetical protein